MVTKEQLIEFIKQIRNDLFNLSSDMDMPIDIKMYRWLQHEVQNIDHELEVNFKEKDKPTIEDTIEDKEMFDYTHR